jgi:hypothetical protein
VQPAPVAHLFQHKQRKTTQAAGNAEECFYYLAFLTIAPIPLTKFARRSGGAGVSPAVFSARA